jgi:hypothetical protein
MDFLDLVLKGYTNKNNREFLDKYFYREFKKAEKNQYFEPEEFFKGCFDIVESFKEELQNKVWKRKQELLMMLERARNKTSKYADLQGKTIEEKRKETIEYCEKELESETTYSIGSMSFTVHLMSMTSGRYLGSLYHHEIDLIETNIIKAKIRVLREKSKALEKSHQKTVEKEPEMTLMEKTADWRFFQIEVIADIEVDGKIYKNVRQKNNDSIIKPDNWLQHKDIFFKQRMAKHKESYTLLEKVGLELEILNKLYISNDDYRILSERYKNYLQDIKMDLLFNPNDEGGSYIELDESTFFTYPVDFHGRKLFISNSEINLSNWYDRVDDFFEYRASTYEEGYSQDEIAKLEIKKVNKLKVTKEKNDVLKSRYFKYLNDILKGDIKKVDNLFKSEKLPPLNNSIILHYGCSDFKSNVDKIYWIGAIEHNPGKKYFYVDESEKEMIEVFKSFLESNTEKTFIHWSMNTPTFGFKHLEKRYKHITGENIQLHPSNDIDLSEYLKTKYGVNYIDRKNGRLNNLAKLNNFSGIQNNIEVKKTNEATNRLELIFSIYQAELQGNLKISNVNKKESQINRSIEISDNSSQENLNTRYFKDIFTANDVDKLTQVIKHKYKNIKGKRLKILLLALKELGILPKERYNKKFHDACKNEFTWPIGSYQSMNDYKFNDTIDSDELKEMKDFIKNI